MALKVFVLNNVAGSVNSVRLVRCDNYHRGSPFRLLGETRSRPDIVISGRTYLSVGCLAERRSVRSPQNKKVNYA
jgi:hypothetical protein